MYVFLAVAPCSFNLGGKQYKLSAGSTFTISPELGEQVRQPTFPYRKHLRLISQMNEVESKSIEVKETEKIVEPELNKASTASEEPKVDSTPEDQTNVVKPKRVSKKVEG